MPQAATTPETPTAPPAAEAFGQEVALLSEMEALSVAFAREFQVHGATALRENKDIAEAGAAETHFSHLFLGMRRSIARSPGCSSNGRRPGTRLRTGGMTRRRSGPSVAGPSPRA